MTNKPVAVIYGGLGFIGHHIAIQLLKSNYFVYIVDAEFNYTSDECYCDRLAAINEVSSCYKIIKARTEDIMSTSAVTELQNLSADVVLHLANMPNNRLTNLYYKEAQRGFGVGTQNVLDLSRDCKHFIYFSSSLVYGDFTVNPQPETGPCSPETNYGKFKLASEAVVTNFFSEKSAKVTIIRPSAVYGIRDNTSRVVSKFMNAAMSNGPMRVNDIATTMDFTYVSDLTAGVVQAIKNQTDKSSVYNLSYGTTRTLGDLTSLTKLIAKSSSDVIINDAESGFPLRPYPLSIQKAKDELGYSPRINLELGLQLCHEYSLRKITRPVR